MVRTACLVLSERSAQQRFLDLAAAVHPEGAWLLSAKAVKTLLEPIPVGRLWQWSSR